MMKKNIVILFFIFSWFVLKAQTNNGKWSDLFSYNNVLAFKENNGKIMAATENGVFYYDTSTGEIKKLSKVNGLHEVKISAFDYNPATNTALIGYQSGNLDVVTDEGVTYIVDIPLSQSYTGSKTINNISINGDKAVLSVGYGVSIFNLSKKEFGDTCFFFNGATYDKAIEATIKDNVVYTVTGNGLKYHPLDVTFSVYGGWSTAAGSYTQVDSSANLLTVGSPYTVYFGNIGTFNALPQNFTNVKDIKVTAANIIVADQARVYVYNLSGILQKTVDISDEINTANIVNGKIYTGTKYSGILDETNTSYKPDGPYSNVSYKLNILGNQIWVATGGRDSGYNAPFYSGLGYYHFDGAKWNYPDYFKTSTFNWNILDVVPNPVKPTEVYFTNYSFFPGQKGIYKMDNNTFVKAYFQNDSNVYTNRIVGCTFDEQNQLFCSVGFINNPNQPSAGFYYYNTTSDAFVLVPVINAYRVQGVFAKDGILWIPSPLYNGGGLISYNYNFTPSQLNDDVYKMVNKSSGMPEDGVICFAIDKNDDAWIGGYTGLRVLPNASDAVNGTPKADPIIITQNNIPEELFKDLKIISIDVDSGNQKWVSVDGGGVFYLSADGEKTLAHFSKVNSPLPSDTVTDIKVDQKTGKVYFCTYDGIVVYQGDVINITSNFGTVKVYPNPVVSSQYKGNVKITGLAEKTNIRITDAVGNVVHQAVARGGYYEWNLNNQKGKRVASGIYFVLMTNEDGTDTATAKIAVVN